MRSIFATFLFALLSVVPAAAAAGCNVEAGRGEALWSAQVGAGRLAPVGGVTACRSGAWSDPATWDGKAPQAGDSVHIPEGIAVTYDLKADAPLLDSVRVDGDLTLADGFDLRVGQGLLLILKSGSLTAGTETAPVSGRIAFGAGADIDVARDPHLEGIGLMAMGRVSLHGEAIEPFTVMTSAVKEGADRVTLEALPVGWAEGQRVVFDATRWIPYGNDPNDPRETYGSGYETDGTPSKGGYWRGDEAEVRRIEEIVREKGGRVTLTLDEPLTYEHAPDPVLAGTRWRLSNLDRSLVLTSSDYGTLHHRGHVMLMTSEADIRYAAFRGLGRTDKLHRAFDAELVEAMTPETNVKGRYPLHVHRAGGLPKRYGQPYDPVFIAYNVIEGAPGWGFAQHGSAADLHRNVAFDIFGSAFVAESGDEVGKWSENHAVRVVGVSRLIKDGADVGAFDLGRTGDGFWLQGRMVRMRDNSVSSCQHGAVWMPRGEYKKGLARVDATSLLQPASFRGRNKAAPNDPHILQLDGFEAYACREAIEVHKENALQNHDLHSVLRDVVGWQVGDGIALQYTGNYEVVNPRLRYAVGAKNVVGSAQNKQKRSIGILFGKNSIGLTLLGGEVHDFGNGLHDMSINDFAGKDKTRTEDEKRHAVLGTQFVDVDRPFVRGKKAFDPKDGSLIYSETLDPLPGAGALALTQDEVPVWHRKDRKTVPLRAEKTDGLGTYAYGSPAIYGMWATNAKGENVPWSLDHAVTNQSLRLALDRYGVYELDGGRVTLWSEWLTNRLNGEREKARVVFRLADDYQIKDKVVRHGALDLAAPPPPRKALPAIRVVSGQTLTVRPSLPEGVEPDGIDIAPYGTVSGGVYGEPILYRPDPDFTGEDSFPIYGRDPATGLTTRYIQRVEVVPAASPA
ncbi:G8 domain-containing protein [Parvularcula dongshanensis]|uniref:G8 domain-containing protein n=1 Tax=Parvularcula dongshanensis TaxID=1173995 RepID=A0A840I0K6_9PROT|nr:G8 domain-containing protein [Parvularcula dongshanensis]MBB4658247.1 hypothetical protein [Parvularcula dongshanensis]